MNGQNGHVDGDDYTFAYRCGGTVLKPTLTEVAGGAVSEEKLRIKSLAVEEEADERNDQYE